MHSLMPPVDTPDNTFHDGNPLTGELGTIVTAAHLNNVQDAVRDTQEELIAVLAAAGNAPDSSAGQLLAALQLLFAAKNDTLGALASLVGANNKLPYFTGANAAALTDISDIGRSVIGQSSIANLLTYLGLGAGAPPIGIPFFWPSAAMPNTVMPEWADMVFMKFNGASFSATTYPQLALVFPSLVIPEARGEFLRTWDDGRGVDSGRALLSAQGDAIRNITGSFGGTTNNDTCSVLGQGVGVFANGTSLVTPTNGSVIGSATRPVTMTLDVSRQVPTASENRSRNIAFNFLVRAK
ncbi:hypothetical protein [Citrobacter amalonaticus]|uniref:hypothetical protein n=1 Tax=Citrobacter amalonaticus TaxID=35703 RepID=UPI00069C9E43|nr:hypothetical protein [Citrobacter amalonaticus]